MLEQRGRDLLVVVSFLGPLLPPQLSHTRQPYRNCRSLIRQVLCRVEPPAGSSTSREKLSSRCESACSSNPIALPLVFACKAPPCPAAPCTNPPLHLVFFVRDYGPVLWFFKSTNRRYTGVGEVLPLFFLHVLADLFEHIRQTQAKQQGAAQATQPDSLPLGTVGGVAGSIAGGVELAVGSSVELVVVGSSVELALAKPMGKTALQMGREPPPPPAPAGCESPRLRQGWWFGTLPWER